MLWVKLPWQCPAPYSPGVGWRSPAACSADQASCGAARICAFCLVLITNWVSPVSAVSSLNQ